jgi:hypothetical protein
MSGGHIIVNRSRLAARVMLTTAALWARMTDRKSGRAEFFPIRYADDFVVLVAGTRELRAPECGSELLPKQHEAAEEE